MCKYPTIQSFVVSRSGKRLRDARMIPLVDERLKEYHAYTEPALEVFRKAGILIDIDGEPTPEAIAENIRAVLDIK